MKIEIVTLESMDAWQIVKRYPDGLIKKFKALFYAMGDQKLEGIYSLKVMHHQFDI